MGTIREYRETDLEPLRALHAQQRFEYTFPDLNDPIFFAGAVADDYSGAAFLRLSAQAYLFLGEGSARDRWQTMLRLHELLRRQAKRVGMREVFCWIPPEIPDKFCKRLTALGWREDHWRNFTFNL